MFGPPISQSAWMVSTRSNRSWYSSSIFSNSARVVTLSVNAMSPLLLSLTASRTLGQTNLALSSPLLTLRRAGPMLNMVLKVLREQLERALDGGRRHTDQTAEALAP